MKSNDLTSLIGKTIEKIEWVPYVTLNEEGAQVDDGDYVMIHFNDGFKVSFVGGYTEGWTGNSANEYPTYLSVNIFEPEGYNGTGMYEARLIHKIYDLDKDAFEYIGHQFHFNGEVKVIPTELFRFRADSLEHAKSLFMDLSEVEYVKWVPSYDIKRGDNSELEGDI